MMTPSGSSAVTGTWSGTASDSISPMMGGGSMMGAGMMSGQPDGGVAWQVTQTGSTFSGSVTMPGHMGGGTMTMSGTLNGRTGTFTMTMPNVTTANGTCTITATGTCDFDDAMQQMRGTYSGTNSCTGPFSGQIAMTRR